MSCETCVCHFLRGEIYIGDASEACPGTVNSLLGCSPTKPALRKVGNVENLNIFIESEVRGLASKTNFLETLACGHVPVNNVRVQMTVNCTNIENLRLALYANDETLSASGTAFQEVHCNSFDSCSYLRTQNIGISNVGLEVKDSMGITVITLVEGSDFKYDGMGIEFLVDVLLSSDQKLHVTYDYDESGYRVVQPLVEAKGPHTIYFRGTNLNGNTPYHVELFKVLLQPTTQLELISSDNFQTFEFNGIVMRDCKRDDGLSQFMELKEIVNGTGCS